MYSLGERYIALLDGILGVGNRYSKGVKPIQPVQYSFENYYLYGAVEPTTGASFFLELPALNSECFQLFLDHFAAEYAESVCLLVLDNGAFHKAKHLTIPKNMVFLFLPPYAPELNPIERVWQDIKERLTLPLFETLDDLKQAVAKILQRYSVQAIASLTGYHYLVHAIYALSD